MAEDHDRLDPDDFRRVLERAQVVNVHHVPGHADVEEVSDGLIEDRLRWDARVHAAQDHREGILPRGRRLNLRKQVLLHRRSGAEPLVPLLQGIERLGRSHGRLRLLGLYDGPRGGGLGRDLRILRQCDNRGSDEKKDRDPEPRVTRTHNFSFESAAQHTAKVAAAQGLSLDLGP